jgi:hypothetical protein
LRGEAGDAPRHVGLEARGGPLVGVHHRRRSRETARHDFDLVVDWREAPELRHRTELQLERQLARALLALLGEDRPRDLLGDLDRDRSERPSSGPSPAPIYTNCSCEWINNAFAPQPDPCHWNTSP